MTRDPWAEVPLEERLARTSGPLPGNTQVTPGNANDESVTRYSPPSASNTVTLYANIAQVLDGDHMAGAAPTYGQCSDGAYLFYAGHVNSIYGDPEGGKTMLAQAVVVEALANGKRVAMLDLDHNGVESTVSRLIDLGADEDALRDPERFRYADPDDGVAIDQIVADLVAWQVELVVIDSIGELVPAFGGSSNSPDDYTRVHRAVLTPLAKNAGACVITIDHLAKNAESRSAGPTGTAAKKRAIGGSMLRVVVSEAFTPGQGGAAHVTISKDRHGGLRRHRATGDKEPLAATFVMRPDYDDPWTLKAPSEGERNPLELVPEADMAQLEALDPPPQSVRDARERLKWNNERAMVAMREFRKRYRVTDTRGPVTGNTCSICAKPMTFDDGSGTHASCEVAS